MPFKRKPGERAAGVPRGPRTPLTAEEKAVATSGVRWFT